MRIRESLLLQPSDINPSHVGWQVVGVLNPGVAIVDNDLVMLARVAQRPAQDRTGMTALPRWGSYGELLVDWVGNHDLQALDARVVAIKRTADLRLTSVSHLQVLRRCRDTSGDGRLDHWKAETLVLPEGESEAYGIEDPRITKIGDTYWITYVAVSKFGALTSLMSSTDMVTFHRHGIIFPSENKDVVLFPQTIDGEYLALHRPNPNSHFSPPQIWMARSPDLIHWGRHEPLVSGRQSWEGDRVGSGTPPILIDEGWLLLYHGSESPRWAGEVGCYAAGALLLDRQKPNRVIARSTAPIMTPITSFENSGFVPKVVFPTALFDQGENLQVFYGAADTCIAMAEFSKRAIVDSLTLDSGDPR